LFANSRLFFLKRAMTHAKPPGTERRSDSLAKLRLKLRRSDSLAKLRLRRSDSLAKLRRSDSLAKLRRSDSLAKRRLRGSSVSGLSGLSVFQPKNVVVAFTPMHFLSLCPSSLAVLEDTKTKRLAMIPEGERALFLKELLQAEMKARNVGQAQGAAALWWPAFFFFSFFFLLH
jgi:hypothetical protein